MKHALPSLTRAAVLFEAIAPSPVFFSDLSMVVLVDLFDFFDWSSWCRWEYDFFFVFFLRGEVGELDDEDRDRNIFLS